LKRRAEPKPPKPYAFVLSSIPTYDIFSQSYSRPPPPKENTKACKENYQYETSQKLKELTTAFHHLCNNRDFDLKAPLTQELIEHLAPDFKSRFDNQTVPISFADQVAFLRAFAEQHPSCYFQVTESSVIFDQRQKKASVEMLYDIHGVSNVAMNAVAHVKWRREVDDWVAYDFTSMRYATFDG
jgi:hypothetical protein